MFTDDDKQWIAEQLKGERAYLLELLKEERVYLHESLKVERAYFLERLEAVETRLLTEFHKWASPQEMRQRTHSAALRAMDLEIEALDDRVRKLEDRPNQT